MVEFDFEREQVFKGVGAVFVALFVTNVVPIVNFIRFIPTFKEILIGAAVVVAFTSASDAGEAAKYALVVGMIGAVAFNVFYIPFSFVFNSALGAVLDTGGSAASSAMASGMLAGFGALTNLFGVVVFSPIGYLIGGLLGSLMN